jgi:hypothetical protein
MLLCAYSLSKLRESVLGNFPQYSQGWYMANTILDGRLNWLHTEMP